MSAATTTSSAMTSADCPADGAGYIGRIALEDDEMRLISAATLLEAGVIIEARKEKPEDANSTC